MQFLIDSKKNRLRSIVLKKSNFRFLNKRKEYNDQIDLYFSDMNFLSDIKNIVNINFGDYENRVEYYSKKFRLGEDVVLKDFEIFRKCLDNDFFNKILDDILFYKNVKPKKVFDRSKKLLISK